MKKLLALTLFLASPLFAQPSVSSIFPASGPTTGGTFVHITGTDLIGFPPACPALSCGDYVQFGDTLADISMHTTTEIVAIAPPHASGTVDITVNVAGKKMIAIPAAFRYEAPDQKDYEPILLPIIAATIAGAFGSVWKSDLTLHNASDEEIQIGAPTCNPFDSFPCPPPPRLFPHATTKQGIYVDLSIGPGVFLYLPRRNINDIDISLRIQDISRQVQTWGTALPVVRATDFKRIVRLNGVPTDSRFRDTLRIYGYSGKSDPVTVRIFDPASSQALVESRFELHGTNSSQSPPIYPAYLQLDPLAVVFPQIRGHELVRVEVESAFVPAQLLWAFVSVANNETQHVTVIAPSP